jgi:hypothetical protein
MENNFGIEPEKLYISSEAAEFLRITPETLRDRARNNQIGHIKQGKRGDYYFSGHDLIAYLKKNYHPAE